MPLKTFRGLLADGGQERLNLHHNDGKIGYRVVKFELMVGAPGSTTQQSVVKIYKISQTTVDGLANFSDNTLLAVGYQGDATGDINNALPTNAVIFDNEIFNQDIYVTHKDVDVGKDCNYYIELEERPLALDEATVATLKDIRNSGDPT